jgi:hypothetical protein
MVEFSIDYYQGQSKKYPFVSNHLLNEQPVAGMIFLLKISILKKVSDPDREYKNRIFCAT